MRSGPIGGAPAFCIEGERVHFLHELDLEQALRHGYLELWLVNDHGTCNRVIRYQPEKSTYLWYEAQEGIAPLARQCKTYGKLEDLLSEHDVHVYKWYPLFPQQKPAAGLSGGRSGGVGGGSLSPFDYHGILDRRVVWGEETGAS